MRKSPVRSFRGLITLVRRSWNSCGGLTSGVARLAQRDIPRITPTNSALPFHVYASRRRDGVSPPRVRISYPCGRVLPPLRSHTSHYKNYTGRWFSVLRRFTVAPARGGDGTARSGQEAARGCAAWDGDVSNERVAAGFENHGIIRQIKLERLRPFFPLPYIRRPGVRWNGLIHVYRHYACRWVSLLITGWFMTSTRDGIVGSPGHFPGSNVFQRNKKSRDAIWDFYYPRVNLGNITKENRSSLRISDEISKGTLIKSVLHRSEGWVR